MHESRWRVTFQVGWIVKASTKPSGSQKNWEGILERGGGQGFLKQPREGALGYKRDRNWGGWDYYGNQPEKTIKGEMGNKSVATLIVQESFAS